MMNLEQAREFFGIGRESDGSARVIILIKGQPEFCCLIEDQTGDVVYGVKDWDRNYSPTWGFDVDGELREFNADGKLYGPPIEWKKVFIER